ncbi:CRAL-TRIO domain-containing protein [Zychaea mexicana]|uniref:CRAL-TRIO domain-containing protein n=1 Tax=Zychaea mexicana TaxID=64656 RepID=UPI0022FF2353|nr:CRAL-TRIO domain-containing protein [Zychaea mexicana]KAI9493938.1 CRAL-TRIO domain-containing protein [Zychaea mexicana]
MVQTLSLEGRLPGHAGALTVEQTASLKRLWLRLFELFQQPGDKVNLPPAIDEAVKEEKPAKNGGGGGFFGFGAKKQPAQPAEEKFVFLGRTADPRWMSLPVDQALPLIPGDKLEYTFWQMVATDNPDAAILRYLRARKWDDEAAYKMLVNTLRWRLHMRVDDITKLGESGLVQELEKAVPGMGDQFLEQMRSGKATLGGPDKSDRGICFINVQLHRKEDQPAEVIQLCSLYLMETARVFCGYPMVNACIVFNLENFTLANWDFEFVKFLIVCLERYYPETLGLCLIHKAPWVFSTVWSVVSPMLDPVVAAKIKFSKNLDEFQQHIDVGSTPVIISKNPDVKTKDEAAQADPPKAGVLETPTTAEYLAYAEEKKQYSKETAEWAKQDTVEKDLDADALKRLERGQQHRITRIKTEKDIRANTIYHEKGLIKLTPEARLFIDFGGGNWEAQDVTERV